MKTNKWLIAVLAVTTLFTACKEDMPTRDDSPLDNPNSIQAYIYDNTSDVLIKPADGGKYLMTIGGEKTTVDAKVFNVLVGRAHAEKADSFQLQVVDESGAFLFDPMVRFDKGSVVDTIAVEVLLDFGESASLTLTVPEEYASSYSASSKTINVNVDYTWLPRGKAHFVSSFWKTEGDVLVQKAKEATDSLFRLVSPYFMTDPISEEEDPESQYDSYGYILKEGYHILFKLDEDWNALEVPVPQDIGYVDSEGMVSLGEVKNTADLIASGAPPSVFADFVNNSNVFYIQAYFGITGLGASGDFLETFTWTDGYPGELTDPAEGEGTVDSLSFGDGKLKAEAGAVTEVLDDELNITQAHNRYTLSFEEDGLNLGLVLVGDSLGGDYKIVSNPIQAGTALAGSYDGAAMQGCYVDAGFTKYYITSGNVHVDVEGTNYSIQVKGVTAKGVELIIECEGTLTEEGATPAPSKVAVRKLTL